MNDRRQVVVAMPFGGSESERRRAILNFNRLKYIIEKRCQVIPHSPTGKTDDRVAYDVVVARTKVDKIPPAALEKIDKADILIALLSERNHTVAYELGFRRARDRTVILVGDSKDDLPVYEAETLCLSWKQDDVIEIIDRIVEEKYPRLSDFQSSIPDNLKEAIQAEDGALINDLQVALQQIENKFIGWAPDPVQKLRGMVSENIHRFYPFSVVEVRFAKKGEFEDQEAPARVVDFDESFSALYGYGSLMAAKLDGPLTLFQLLSELEKFSDADDWELFMQEQHKLTAEVIKGYGHALATVPIKLNQSHPKFKGKWFLPCMAAQVIDGSLDGPHQMYLLIVYIEINNESRNASVGIST